MEAVLVRWIEVREMHFYEREDYIRMVGRKQDCCRALYIGLLPAGEETCYTASEVGRRVLPTRSEEEYDFYTSDSKVLGNLALENGLRKGGEPGPDNLDHKGRLLPGRKRGARQRCKWNRCHWHLLINDAVYEWLQQLNQKIIDITASQPSPTKVFCDLDTFVLSTVMEPERDVRKDETAENAKTAEGKKQINHQQVASCELQLRKQEGDSRIHPNKP